MWEAFGNLQSHIRQRAKWPELVPTHVGTFRQESRALLVGTEDLFKAAMFPNVFPLIGGWSGKPNFFGRGLLFRKKILVRISRHEGCDEFIPDNTSDVLSFRWFLFPDSTMVFSTGFFTTMSRKILLAIVFPTTLNKSNQWNFQGPPNIGTPFPYYSHTTPIRIPKDMGMVWE